MAAHMSLARRRMAAAYDRSLRRAVLQAAAAASRDGAGGGSAAAEAAAGRCEDSGGSPTPAACSDASSQRWCTSPSARLVPPVPSRAGREVRQRQGPLRRRLGQEESPLLHLVCWMAATGKLQRWG
mmetsp:Transcript_86106/g.216739  ORF Transcript_86106/g.216739 Transcript_86106/m.216739 type:complete len:126 (-) Transcript_86106:129-506(-)